MPLRRWRGHGAPLAGFLAAVLSVPAAAQVDMDVMQKWAAVTVEHYAVVGVYSADTLVVNAGTNGYAEVGDRVEIGFDWDQTEAELVGEPDIENFPAETGTLRNGAAGCRAPTLGGSYEHFTLLSLKEGLGGQLEMSAQRNVPGANMPVACTGGSE